MTIRTTDQLAITVQSKPNYRRQEITQSSPLTLTILHILQHKLTISSPSS